MKAKTCTQCGAPIQGNKCEYCGTEFLDVSDNIRTLEQELALMEFEVHRAEQEAILFNNFLDEYYKVHEKNIYNVQGLNYLGDKKTFPKKGRAGDVIIINGRTYVFDSKDWLSIR